MFIKSKSIVLSNLKFGESDLIVKTYTNIVGPVSFLLKGVRKSKKGKFKVASFQPMSLLEIEFNYRENKNLQYLTEAKTYKALHDVHTSFYKSTILMFMAEVLSNCIKEETDNKGLFLFLEGFLIQLESASKIGNYPIQFCLELSRHLGFYPSYIGKQQVYFNLLEGNFADESINSNCKSGSEVEKLKEFLLTTNFETIVMNQTSRRSLLLLLLSYYEFHVPNFKAPKTLDVIESLFG